MKKDKPLNINLYDVKSVEHNGAKMLFDPVRKKYLIRTPEEWVRQQTIQYLHHEKNYPLSLMAIEKSITVNNMIRRCDIVMYNNHGSPCLIVECKAAKIPLSQAVFDQAAQYNSCLKVPFLVVTNGRAFYCCRINFESNNYTFESDIPTFENLLES